MRRLPTKTSLVAETASTLKEWIANGEIRKTMPGEMRLKTLLGVGRNTLRLALKILEDEHLITSSSQGEQRRIQNTELIRGPNVLKRDLPVVFLSPFPVVDRIILLELEELQTHLAQQGRELRFVCTQHLRSERPGQRLQRLVEENPAAAWMLHFVNEATQRWFEQTGLPTFIYGSPFPGVTLPFVVNDWESAAFHAGLQLFRHGHRVIAQMAFELPIPGALAIERGLRRAMAAIQAPSQLHILKDDISPQTVVRLLEMVYRFENRPTALVFCSSSQLLTCYSWMVSKGIAVPADFSLICIPSDSWFQDLNPPVCHYENNPKTFARLVRQKVMELVESGRVAKAANRARMEYKEGATIGPARRPPV